MAIIQPFQAVRPVRNKVCIVPSYPYEQYNQHEINRIIKTNPYSFLNIIASSYIRRLPKEKKYRAIRKQFGKFKKRGIYVQDYLPFLYVLRITDVSGNVFVGIVGLTSVEDYKGGRILRHEKTLQKRVQAFAEYLKNVRIQADPVMLTYPSDPEVNELQDKYIGQVPEYEFSTTDGTVYEAWLVSDFDDLKAMQRAFSKIERLYIADGHHRVESTLAMQEEMKKANPYHTGNEAYNYLLSFFIPFDRLKIYPFHRGLKNLNGLDEKIFLERLKEKFKVEKLDKFEEPGKHEMILLLQGDYYKITIPEKNLKNGKNDVEVLNDEIIQGILKINDPRNNKIIRYHEGKPGLKCVLRSIKEKQCTVSFFMHPLTFNEIKSVADAGLTLPPKSTYIDPKLLTGLFIYEF